MGLARDIDGGVNMIDDYHVGIAEAAVFLAEQMKNLNDKLDHISDSIDEMNPQAGRIQFEDCSNITEEQFKFDYEEDFG